MGIEIHPLTRNPTAAWEELAKSQKFIKINVRQPVDEVASDKVRIVCMSDTHSRIPQINFDIPLGDVFIHAGDFTKVGLKKEVIDFNDWLGTLPHKHKIVIAGNHELSFDHSLTRQLSPSAGERARHTGHSLADCIPTMGMPRESIKEALKSADVKNRLTNCIYLEDNEVTLYGLKFYGSPWNTVSSRDHMFITSEAGKCLKREQKFYRFIHRTRAFRCLMWENILSRQPEFQKWAFGAPRGWELLKKWDKIPDDTDILITHTPPIGHGDLCCTGVRAGCVELLATVQQRVRPKYHVFGHIHEGYGVTSDGKIIFVNASTCDLSYFPRNLPIVFDVTLPPGVSKS